MYTRQQDQVNLLDLAYRAVNEVFGRGLQDADRDDYAQTVALALAENERAIKAANEPAALAYDIARKRARNVLTRTHATEPPTFTDLTIIDVDEYGQPVIGIGKSEQ